MMLTDLNTPKVSVVIPTHKRPALLLRAVESALRQTYRQLEVVVVIDGPDAQTGAALAEVGDSRLRVISLDENMGGSEARNIGARHARGNWIALLDDDDEWMPEKIEAQLKAAESISGPHIFVACKFLERAESAERILPARMPEAGEYFSDYIFSRKGWGSAEGFLQTSTWFVSRQLMLDVPFTVGLKRCQDLDWMLRATALPNTQVMVVPQALAIFHHDERPERVSRSPDWRFLYQWGSENRRYFTARAFSFFVATFCVPSATRQKEPFATFFFLLKKCVFDGAPTAKCLLLFLVCWLMPESRRRVLRFRLQSAAEIIRNVWRGSHYKPLPGQSR